MTTSGAPGKDRLRILAISEHYLPRVAGTTTSVVETARALAAAGHTLTLIVPGKARPEDAAEPYEVVRLTPEWPEWPKVIDPPRAIRYAFADAATAYAQAAAAEGRVDVVHVLFGLFVMERMAPKLPTFPIPAVATIHNMPPLECARSFPGDHPLSRLRDRVRVALVAAKNRRRLSGERFDTYIVPSGQVADLVRRTLPDARVATIGHGVGDTLLTLMRPPATRRPAPGAPISLLTVGGIVPHKRQLLIPETAARLRDRGVDVDWTMVGPSRNAGYRTAIESAVARHDVGDRVHLLPPAEWDELAALYDAANLYVQPSIEEGFCLTALDAAAAGLSVIGSPAGALPDLVEISGGRLVVSRSSVLADAVEDFVAGDRWVEDALGQSDQVCRVYSWMSVAKLLEELYREFAVNKGGCQCLNCKIR